jgi:hypothetical protein
MGDKDRAAFYRRRWKAKRAGVRWGLAYEDVGPPPEHCPCCGVRMERGDENGGRRTAPTLERLIPERGYVPSNVIWLCWLCNTTKSNHTLADLYRVADFFWERFKERGLPLPRTRLYDTLRVEQRLAGEEEPRDGLQRSPAAAASSSET